MATETFQINTEAHEATVGEHKFRFKPEVYSDELLDAWAELRAVTAAAAEDADQPGDDAAKIAERSKKVNAATRAFVSELMVPESAELFATVKLPDRVLLEMQRWILGVYGLRPTSASSDSSAPPATPTPGDDSTGTSPDEAPTP